MSTEQEESEDTLGEPLGDTDSSGGGSATQFTSLVEAYEQSDVDTEWYLTRVTVPALVGALVLVAVTVALGFPLIVIVPVILLSTLIIAGALFYPKIQVDGRRVEMDRRYHLFITHLTVLSLTNINRVNVIEQISKQKQQYAALADEAQQVKTIVKTWNQSLDDAFRQRAREVPSDQVRDLFERLSYTLGTGRELEDFLVEEQDLILSQYNTTYERSVRNIKVFINLYEGMTLAVTFGLVFTIVLPVITGHDPFFLILVVAVVFAIVQFGFYFFIRALVPYDPVWYRTEDSSAEFSESRVTDDTAADDETEAESGRTRNETARRLRKIGIGGAIGAAGLLVLLAVTEAVAPAVLGSLPIELYPAVAATPLVVPAFLYRKEQQRIRKRDEEFPNLIRALGSSETIRQSTTTEVLSSLKQKDFGSLDGPVNNLYTRLKLRLDQQRAWDHFAAESNSFLVQQFTDMYTVARRLGGEPKQLGEVIGENVSAINELRDQRSQEVTTLVGVLYGLAVASAFAFFVGLEVVGLIADLDFDSDGFGAGGDLGQILSTQQYDIPLLRLTLLGLLVYNAFLATLTIKEANGGHLGASLIHFVGFTYASCGTAFITTIVIDVFVNV